MPTSDEAPALRVHRELHAACGKVLDETLQKVVQLGNVHDSFSQLEVWTKTLKMRPQAVCLEVAILELSLGLHAAITGLYRHAFRSLRLGFELALATVHFSAHRLELAEWHMGQKDLLGSSLLDEKNGILSRRFSGAFFPELNENTDEVRGVAKRLYRELSEIVHGNPKTWTAVPGEVKFHDSIYERLVYEI